MKVHFSQRKRFEILFCCIRYWDSNIVIYNAYFELLRETYYSSLFLGLIQIGIFLKLLHSSAIIVVLQQPPPAASSCNVVMYSTVYSTVYIQYCSSAVYCSIIMFGIAAAPANASSASQTHTYTDAHTHTRAKIFLIFEICVASSSSHLDK